MNYSFNIPTKILYGYDALKQLHEEKLPYKRAMIVTSSGKSVIRNGALQELEDELDLSHISYFVFNEIRPNPTVENVNKGAALARKEGADVVIALGGGSVMDASKCIAFAAENEGDFWDYMFTSTGKGKETNGKTLPTICITTSAGTASEVDPWGVISKDETGEKGGFGYDFMYPVLSIVDARLTLSVPSDFTAFQGMDAFYHAAESMVNKKNHPLGRMFALEAIRLISKNLPVAYKEGNNIEARENMALGQNLAGFYMLCTAEHTMEHSMGGLFPHLPHGAGLILISHEYFKYIADTKRDEKHMIEIANAMGKKDASSGEDMVKALDELILAVGQKDLKMSDYGIKKEDMARFADNFYRVTGGDPDGDPIKLTKEEILGIYERSYR